MKKYVFVGGLPSSILGVVDFKKFGQRQELSDGMARDASRGGCMILPEDAPEVQAFEAKELERYQSFGSHANASPEFLRKKTAAVIAAIALSEAYEMAYQQELEAATTATKEEVM